MAPTLTALSNGDHMEDIRKCFHWAETQADGSKPAFSKRPNDPYDYLPGFGNHFESEIQPGTIPQGQNNPRVVRYGLYTEQITGTSFVAPRKANKRAWLYRARPAVAHKGFTDLSSYGHLESCFLARLNPKVHLSATQLAWKPEPFPAEPTDFLQGLRTVAGSGDPTLGEGLATYIYAANESMLERAFVNSDGEMLIVPQEGSLDMQTELGRLFVQPGEIVVIPKGLRFRVGLGKPSRGYALEVWNSNGFELPELGPLGANGLANPRDFLHPTAFYDDRRSMGDWKIVYKLGGSFFQSRQEHSPFDVVGWHGNYVPYKYDLTKFINVGSISVDHIDPSIFCVLTAASTRAHTPLADFLLFSPRWDVASNTYRPPYYHRNAASEVMGLIYGSYGGRSSSFQPGSVSFETSMVPHGVAFEEFTAASNAVPPVMRISEGSMAFMFESGRCLSIAEWAWTHEGKHEHEPEMWEDLIDNYSSSRNMGQKP